MKRFAAIAALAFGLLATPAQAQDAMLEQLDFGMLREIVDELDFELIEEGVDEDGDYFLEVESDTGLLFYLYGAICDDDDPALGCTGLNMVATFSLADGNDPLKVIDTVSYAFMKLYRSGEDVKVSRYLIFDGGISRENLKQNISIYAEIGDLIWEDLSDADVLEE